MNRNIYSTYYFFLSTDKLVKSTERFVNIKAFNINESDSNNVTPEIKNEKSNYSTNI